MVLRNKFVDHGMSSILPVTVCTALASLAIEHSARAYWQLTFSIFSIFSSPPYSVVEHSTKRLPMMDKIWFDYSTKTFHAQRGNVI